MKNFSRRDYSILIGNCIDHFDSALYGFLAPILGPLFFPQSDPLISIILAYSIFATSIITRPIGSFVFGVIAKNYGPINALSYSLVGVAITTAAIGFVPTYESIGPLAPIFLIIARSAVGIFSAGEVTIASLYILQNKDQKAALKSSYYYQMSSMLGIILASQIAAFIIGFDLQKFWRFPFIIGGIAAASGYYLRKYKDERVLTGQKKLLQFYSINNLSLLWSQKKNLLKISIISSFSYTTYAVPFILMNSLIPLITDITLAEMMKINTYLLVFDMLLFPIIGKLLLRFEAKKILVNTCFLMLFSIIPIWYYLKNASILYVSFVRIWIILIGVMFACQINIWFNRLIETDEKYLISGIGNAVGTSLVGRMTPAFCLSLYYYTGSYMSTVFYIAISAILTVTVLILD